MEDMLKTIIRVLFAIAMMVASIFLLLVGREGILSVVGLIIFIAAVIYLAAIYISAKIWDK